MKIKYRVWDVNNNRPIDSELFSIDGTGVVNPELGPGRIEIDPWTNCKDKFQANIYLNDIIRLYDWNEGVNDEDVNEDRVVGFREGCFTAEALSQNDPGYCNIDMLDMTLTEVIMRREERNTNEF